MSPVHVVRICQGNDNVCGGGFLNKHRTFFTRFIKAFLYKEREAGKCPKLKNMLRRLPRLRKGEELVQGSYINWAIKFNDFSMTFS